MKKSERTTKKKISSRARSAMSDGGKRAQRGRWGTSRGPSKLIRIDADAADLIANVSDRDKRSVASNAIREASRKYLTLAEQGEERN